MSRCRRPSRRLFCLALLFLLSVTGCSRPNGSDDGAAQTGQHQVPFQDGTGTGSSNLHTKAAKQDHPASGETGLPFRDDQSLPAGTMLTVRLKRPIAADDPGASGTFEAIMDEPLVIDGNTLIPRGANAVGRVEAARSSQVKRNRGYVRLILDSIDIAGRDLPVQTSSLFARGDFGETGGPDGDGSTSVIHLEKGRRLTFRLTEPVSVVGQRPIPAH